MAWRRRRAKRERAELLAGAVKLCEEDVTVLGEQLQRMDAQTADHPLDEVARIDYQTVLDAYESADRALRKVTAPGDVTAVTGTLNEGRYALACVQAQLAGEPRPQLRAPCFFNPQHGPSTKDVMFTPPGGGTRRVAACAQDAARIEAGERPAVRTIEVGGQVVPYRDAFDASVVLDHTYHAAAIRAGEYGGFPKHPGGGF